MKYIIFIFYCLCIFSFIGCSAYNSELDNNNITITQNYDNCLNAYNSYLDNFSGSIEKGKIYYYSNKNFPPELHFEIIQVFEEKEAFLVYRRYNIGKIQEMEKYGTVCNSAIFLILSNQLYADGAKLRDGEYICVGTYTYETENKTQKTVYVFMDKEYYQKKEAAKYVSVPQNNSNKITPSYTEQLVSVIHQLWNPPSSQLLNGRVPKVYVKVHFNCNGKVLKAEITKKSGFLPMDRSVQELLGDLKQVPPPPSGEPTEIEFILVPQE